MINCVLLIVPKNIEKELVYNDSSTGDVLTMSGRVNLENGLWPKKCEMS